MVCATQARTYYHVCLHRIYGVCLSAIFRNSISCSFAIFQQSLRHYNKAQIRHRLELDLGFQAFLTRWKINYVHINSDHLTLEFCLGNSGTKMWWVNKNGRKLKVDTLKTHFRLRSSEHNTVTVTKAMIDIVLKPTPTTCWSNCVLMSAECIDRVYRQN